MKIKFEKEYSIFNEISLGISFKWGCLGTRFSDLRKHMFFDIQLLLINTYIISFSWFSKQ